jgi:uncharacterized protein YndB with AHSA1/START domain
MTHVDSSRALEASGDAVWRVVADPSRLTEWVPTTRLAQPSDAEHVHLEGESHGHPYTVTSPLHIDEAERRLHWSAPELPGYQGSLEVLDRDGGSEVQIHLTVPDEKIAASHDMVAEIQRGTEEALDRLVALVGS